MFATELLVTFEILEMHFSLHIYDTCVENRWESDRSHLFQLKARISPAMINRSEVHLSDFKLNFFFIDISTIIEIKF